MSIKKKIIDQNVGNGRLRTASGYITNASPGPVNQMSDLKIKKIKAMYLLKYKINSAYSIH